MPTSLKKAAEWGAWFVAFLLLVLLLDWANETFRSEFGRYSDEGTHYVTGLLIRDYITSGNWTQPIRFALDFYARFPKVALGTWPPGFELLQALWGLVFGVARPSMMAGMAVLTALLAVVTFRATSAHVPTLFAAAAAVAMVAAPLTQAQAAMVMAEIPLALFSFLAITSWISFSESDARRHALAFGLWTTAAILTKGNAWVIPLVVSSAIVLQWKWSLLRSSRFWLAVEIIVLFCVPFTLLTMQIQVQGWDTRGLPGLPFIWQSFKVHHGYIAGLLGVPLYLVVWAGLADRVLVPLFRRRAVDPFWAILGLYGLMILVFHALVPTSVEPRKIYQIAPVLSAFLAAGLELLSRALGRAMPPKLAPAAALVIGAAGFWWSGFSVIQPFIPGFGPAVSAVIHAQDSKNTAILIASDRIFDDAEAAIIAEWASRQRDPGTFLVRGNKLLSRLASVVDLFEPYDQVPEQMVRRLEGVPLSYVILHDTNASHPYRHQALLRATMEQFPEKWERVYSTSREALGAPQKIQIYRHRDNVQGIPIHIPVDLGRKLGSLVDPSDPEN